MRMVRGAVTAMLFCGLMNPAFADACVQPGEAMALKTAAVQQQLMVAAFMCGEKASYNRFVTAYQTELQGSDARLKSYFVRQDRRHGELNYDAYKTRAANLSALQQARDRTFCALAGQLFAAALESQAPLERFQEKWIPVFRPEPRQNKEIEHFRDSKKHENALG